MSKIKNGGLDQYGKVYSVNGIGGERVNFRCSGVHAVYSNSFYGIVLTTLHDIHICTQWRQWEGSKWRVMLRELSSWYHCSQTTCWVRSRNKTRTLSIRVQSELFTEASRHDRLVAIISIFALYGASIFCGTDTRQTCSAVFARHRRRRISHSRPMPGSRNNRIARCGVITIWFFVSWSRPSFVNTYLAHLRTVYFARYKWTHYITVANNGSCTAARGVNVQRCDYQPASPFPFTGLLLHSSL